MGRRGLRLVRNLWFDEVRQERQRLLPRQVAGFDWNHRRQPLLYDFELGSAGDPPNVIETCISPGMFGSSNLSVYRIRSCGVSSMYVPPKEWRVPVPKFVNDIR